jgi:hypothetical protein
VSDGVVMATGGTVAETLTDVLDTTVATLDLLALPQVSAQTRQLIDALPPQRGRIVCFRADGEAVPLELTSALGEGVAMAREVERLGAETLFVGGALTQESVEDLLRVLPPRRELRLVVRDATVLVLPAATLARLIRRGVTVEVLTPLRVLAVTANPFRLPQPFQSSVFFRAVAEAVGHRAPVFDVVNGQASGTDRGTPSSSNGKRVTQ